MPAPSFSARSEYRSPNRNAFNATGTEGTRSPGNLPRTFGALYSDAHSAEFKTNGSSAYPMHAMYASPKQHSFGAIEQNPKAKSLPPMWSRPIAFSWAGRTSHPDLTPTTIKLDRQGQPVYLETGIGALRYDNEGTGFAINQTYKDDDNDGAADMNDHIGGGAPASALHSARARMSPLALAACCTSAPPQHPLWLESRLQALRARSTTRSMRARSCDKPVYGTRRCRSPSVWPSCCSAVSCVRVCACKSCSRACV